MKGGIKRKTLTYGQKNLLVEFIIPKGAKFPEHAHPYEQIGYLVKGKLSLWIGNKQFEVNPGDSWCIPADVTHKVIAEEDSIAVDVFSPPREDYMVRC